MCSSWALCKRSDLQGQPLRPSLTLWSSTTPSPPLGLSCLNRTKELAFQSSGERIALLLQIDTEYCDAIEIVPSKKRLNHDKCPSKLVSAERRDETELFGLPLIDRSPG
jgi:hypothetical protein